MSSPDPVMQAASLAKEGKLAEAITLVDTILRDDRDNLRAWMVMTELMTDNQDKITCVQEILRLQPDNKKALDYLAKLREKVNAKSATALPPVASIIPVAPATKNCPYCAETIKAEAVVCRFCGRDLTTSAPIPSVPPSQIIDVRPVHPLTIQQVPTKPKQRGCTLSPALIALIGVLGCLVGLSLLLTAVPTSLNSSQITPSGPTFTPLPPTATVDPETAKANWGTVDIWELVKNPDKYIGSELHYKGEVFNIQEDSSGAVMQVWVQVPGGNKFDREAVIVYWHGTTTDIFEGTTIEFWGNGLGSIQGTNAFGATIQQPSIAAKYVTYFTP